MAIKDDKLSKLHWQLLKDIAEELTDEDLNALKRTAKGDNRVRTGKISACRTPHDVLDYFDKAGVIGVGNYSELKYLLGDQPRFLKLMEECEEQMGSLGQQTIRDVTNDSPTPSKCYKPNTSGAFPSTSSVTTDLQDNPCYECPPDSQGILVIFNQFTAQREGTKADEEYIKDFFCEQLKYQLYPRNDLSKEQFIKELETVATYIKVSPVTFAPLVIVVLSHGNENGILTCRSPKEEETGQYLTVDELTKCFKGGALEKLRDIPKLFIIQACRGTVGQDGGIRSDDQSQEENLPDDMSQLDMSLQLTTPHDADMLTAFSTTKGYKSFRHRFDGSFFVQILIDTFRSHYHEEHVVDMLTRVNGMMADRKFPDDDEGMRNMIKKQMPCFFSTLRKKFYLKR